jgi:hypothetical protein
MSRGARAAAIAWLVAAVYYLTAFQPLLYGVGLAIVLTVILRETGPGSRSRLGMLRERHDY